MEPLVISAVAGSNTAVTITLDLDSADRVTVFANNVNATFASAEGRLFRVLLSAGRPLDKAQIVARVWPDSKVANDTANNALYLLRKALEPALGKSVVRRCKGRPALYDLALRVEGRAADDIVIPNGVWPRRLIVCDQIGLCASVISRLAFRVVEKNPGAGIILPTGLTAGMLFGDMVGLAAQKERRGLDQARYFIDTEILGITPRHKASRHSFVRGKFIEPLRASGYGLAEDNVNFFQGVVPADDHSFERYADRLNSTPLALHVISIQPTGGVIGYSASTYAGMDLRALIADNCPMLQISETHRRYIGVAVPFPAVISVGFFHVMRAAELLLPVFHPSKAGILAKLLQGAPDPALPATLLRLHTNVTLVTTRTVAGEAANDERVIVINDEDDIPRRLGPGLS